MNCFDIHQHQSIIAIKLGSVCLIFVIEKMFLNNKHVGLGLEFNQIFKYQNPLNKILSVLNDL